MNEKDEALAYSQLLLLHAESITDFGVKDMVVNSATELVVLHYQAERLKADNERLREALAWAYNLRHLRGHSDPVVIPERFAPFIEAALRREDKA